VEFSSSADQKIQSLVTPPSYFASGITGRIQKLDAEVPQTGR
jgi:hypothetical protein